MTERDTRIARLKFSAVLRLQHNTNNNQHVIVEALKLIDELQAIAHTQEAPDINQMVSNFLGWKLPADFSPDAGITFAPEYNKEYMATLGKPPMKHEPTGTNLFNADQAKAMIEHLLASPTEQKGED